MKRLLLTTIAALVLVGCGPDISIHKAASTGNIEAVKQHIAAGADVNAKSAISTPLHQAAYKGHKEIAELLIAAGADVNASRIGSYTRGNNVKEYNNGITPLHDAAAMGHKEIAELLIAKGANVNAKSVRGHTPVDRARRKKEINILLLKHGGKSGASDSIHVAADLGNIEAVKQHLAAGADVDAKFEDNQSTRFWELAGRTPLHYAAEDGHKEIAELLITNGADVNARKADGWSPLHQAAHRGNREIVELLIAKSADVNAKENFGPTPLDWAIRRTHTETATLLRKHGGKSGEELPPASLFEVLRLDLHWVEDLIAKGADVNAKAVDGGTPLFFAARLGRKDLLRSKEIVELLIAKGADVNVRGHFGMTPLNMVDYKGGKEIANLLRKHGGKTGEELKAEGL